MPGGCPITSRAPAPAVPEIQAPRDRFGPRQNPHRRRKFPPPERFALTGRPIRRRPPQNPAHAGGAGYAGYAATGPPEVGPTTAISPKSLAAGAILSLEWLIVRQQLTGRSEAGPSSSHRYRSRE